MAAVAAVVVVLAIVVSAIMIPKTKKPDIEINSQGWSTDYTYVFVHGLSGWGHYDIQNKAMPYWGMLGGNLMKYLRSLGFSCVDASVAPQGSAWDRACELYAQLTGTVVDYGKAHSEKMGHDRYGEDFTGRALIDKWSEEDKISLLGHSFGGATVRMLVSLMAQGDEEEMLSTDINDVSPLFTGNKSDWIYSVTTLAAPHNGTTAYSINNDDSQKKGFTSKLMSLGTAPKRDGRSDMDYADYDMFIDNAIALNDSLAMPDSIYYFSFACSSSEKNDDGTYSVIDEKTEKLFRDSGNLMGSFTGTTPNGFVIDESWYENDGLVNTVSAMAPLNQPSKEFDGDNVESGVWNIMPIYYGDHMSLQGGLMKTNDVKGFYAELLNMINNL